MAGDGARQRVEQNVFAVLARALGNVFVFEAGREFGQHCSCFSCHIYSPHFNSLRSSYSFVAEDAEDGEQNKFSILDDMFDASIASVGRLSSSPGFRITSAMTVKVSRAFLWSSASSAVRL